MRRFGSIKRLPSGRYRASFAHPHDPARRVAAPITFSHKGDAEHWLRLQQRAIERGEWLSPEEEEDRRPQKRTLQETYDRSRAP